MATATATEMAMATGMANDNRDGCGHGANGHG